MEVIELDYINVVIAAIVYMICGAIWYTPSLFGRTWMKANHVHAKKRMTLLIVAFANAFLLSFFLALLIAYLGATSTMDGIYAALGAWLGFVVTTQLPAYLWSNRSWKGFFIDVGFYFIGFGAMGAIIGA